MDANAKLDNARQMYADGFTPEEIGPKVGRSPRQVRNWIKDGNWTQGTSALKTAEAKYNRLLALEDPSPAQLKEREGLSRELSRLMKASGKQKERLELERNKVNWPALYRHQTAVVNDTSPFRLVLKARQTGFTLSFADEALEDALKNERDKIWIAASFRQTGKARAYVKRIAREKYGLKLRGSEAVELPNGARFLFLPSNPDTAQGESGDVYFDEFGWARRAQMLFESVAAAATRGNYRVTVFSTPSYHSHYFRDLWEGKAAGNLRFTRHKITIINAMLGGDPDIDLEKILGFFSPPAIRRLYMCEFGDDRGSVFTQDEIMAVVSEDEGDFAVKPGDTYWVGVDVSRWDDDTSVWIWAVDKRGDKPRFAFRHVLRMNRVPFTVQRERIKALLADYRPEEVVVDRTQIGEYLADALGEDFPVTPVRFSAPLKERLVLGIQQIIQDKRVVLPNDDRVIDSFLAIKRKALEANVGYTTEGNDRIGHADDFWAAAMGMLPSFDGGTSSSLLLRL